MARDRMQSSRPQQAEVEKEEVRRDKVDDRRSPRAGRTGGLGSRAERPSEGTPRTGATEDTTARTPEPARGSKAPSARKRAGH
jgi:hypothetical protein